MLATPDDVSLCEIRKRRKHYKRLKEIYFNRELFFECDRLSKYMLLSEIVVGLKAKSLQDTRAMCTTSE